MAKVNGIQAMILAGQLKQLGFTDTTTVPLATWLQLGFLVEPTACLRLAIQNTMSETNA